ncbi:hypothetical protein BCY86_03385 [Pajaroellobacter abortibovis]|uniref:Uncharacterized protein n=1 Tax=Pajaroellobacter abortibovis TaxID=1882918 RepID=A0A1L6MWD0_9BACT|nr:hypothetical protein BCY86_03385 [Pajaroellobacter abortibovis]
MLLTLDLRPSQWKSIEYAFLPSCMKAREFFLAVKETCLDPLQGQRKESRHEESKCYATV